MAPAACRLGGLPCHCFFLFFRQRFHKKLIGTFGDGYLGETLKKGLFLRLTRGRCGGPARIRGLSGLLNQPSDLLMCQSVTADDEVIRVFTEVLLKSPAGW